MKRRAITTAILVSVFGLTSMASVPVKNDEMTKQFGQTDPRLQPKEIKIDPNTKSINYTWHSNSGVATSTEVSIYPDSLVWYYSEMRNGTTFRDVVKYKRKHFNALISTLSQYTITTMPTTEPPTLGGSGWSYYFCNETKCYLSYNNFTPTTGTNDVNNIIQDFIENHKTECQKEFEKLAKKPHEKADFGEFKTVPKSLRRYLVE